MEFAIGFLLGGLTTVSLGFLFLVLALEKADPQPARRRRDQSPEDRARSVGP